MFYLILDLLFIFIISILITYIANTKAWCIYTPCLVLGMIISRKLCFAVSKIAIDSYYEYQTIHTIWFIGMIMGAIYTIIVLKAKRGKYFKYVMAWFGVTIINGISMSEYMVVASHVYKIIIMMFFMYASLCCLHFIVPEKNISAKWWYAFGLIASSFILLQSQSILCGSLEPLSMIAYVANVILIWVVLLITMFVSGSINVAIGTGAVLNYIWTMVHYYVYRLRGTVFLPVDISGVGTAADVASGYQYTINREIWAFTILSLLMVLLAIYMPCMKFNAGSVKHHIITAVIGLTSLSGILIGWFNTDFIEYMRLPYDAFDQCSTYDHCGRTLGFMVFLKAGRVEKPDGYSEEKVAELLCDYIDEKDISLNTEEKPDIIVIMNESWADLADVGEFSTNEDYMPFYHELETSNNRNLATGRVLVSSLGGGTCNTEYEFLTGNCGDLTPSIQPFSTEINKDTYSLATTLNSQGYYSIGTHPALGTNWRRSLVYKCLGFDRSIFLDEYNDENELMRGYVSDMDMYQQIKGWISETANDTNNKSIFLFGVTIQNHGGYEPGLLHRGDTKLSINVTGHAENGELDEYLSLIYETDRALEYLVNEVNCREKPTVLVMFGDHFPGGNLYNEMDAIYTEGLDFEQTRRSTPYIVYANYDLDLSRIDDYIGIQYLAAEVLDAIGLDETPYQRYLMEQKKKIPLLNAYGYWDCDINEWKELDKEDKTNKYIDIINNYDVIQYSYRYGASDKRWFVNE